MFKLFSEQIKRIFVQKIVYMVLLIYYIRQDIVVDTISAIKSMFYNIKY